MKFIAIIPDGAQTKPEQLRFFCMGKELQDDLFVYSYDLHDEITIICNRRKN
jgi:hypothetical protein